MLSIMAPMSIHLRKIFSFLFPTKKKTAKKVTKKAVKKTAKKAVKKATKSTKTKS